MTHMGGPRPCAFHHGEECLGEPGECPKRGCFRDTRDRSGQAHRMMPQRDDPLDPRERPTDFQAARDEALRLISERRRTPKRSSEVEAALLVSSALLAVAEAIHEGNQQP